MDLEHGPPRNDNVETDKERFKSFQEEINSYGTNHPFFDGNSKQRPLVWEFSEREKNAVYLDLIISLKGNHFHTAIYEKKMNLHLYIPPHSCHPPGVLKGLIFGAVKRAKNLCSEPKDMMPYIKKTLERLTKRGHPRQTLIPMFNLAIKKIIMNPPPPRQVDPEDANKETDSLFLHLPYNPLDPPSKCIQTAFKETILNLDNTPITNIKRNIDFKRLTVCYHGQKKIGSALAPRRLRLGDGFQVSEFLNSLTNE